MNYSLPTSVELGGREYAIRSDFRPVLDICTVLSDPEADEEEKAFWMLTIFYPDLDEIPPELYRDALKECARFINCGEVEKPQKAPKLVDWEQDFLYIVAPVNRIAGRDVRSLEYLHWWTFVGYYFEIGDCTLSMIVGIRDKLRKHKKLENYEKDFYRQNRELVDFKNRRTEEEDKFLRALTGKPRP